jgi:hypothetical protein
MADQAPVPASEPADPAGADDGSGDGGNVVDALMGLEKALASVVQAASQDPQFPDEAKQAFQGALDAYQQGLQALSSSAQGGGSQPSGPVSMEQGASGAVPMTHGSMR